MLSVRLKFKIALEQVKCGTAIAVHNCAAIVPCQNNVGTKCFMHHWLSELNEKITIMSQLNEWGKIISIINKEKY